MVFKNYKILKLSKKSWKFYLNIFLVTRVDIYVKNKIKIKYTNKANKIKYVF